MIRHKPFHSSYFILIITWLSRSQIFAGLNRRLELVMNRRLQYASPFECTVQCTLDCSEKNHREIKFSVFFTCLPQNTPVTTRVQNIGKSRQTYGVCLFFTLHPSDSSGHRGDLRKTCIKQKILLKSQVKFYVLYLSSENHTCDLYRPKRWKNQANLVFYLTLLGLQRSQG